MFNTKNNNVLEGYYYFWDRRRYRHQRRSLRYGYRGWCRWKLYCTVGSHGNRRLNWVPSLTQWRERVSKKRKGEGKGEVGRLALCILAGWRVFAERETLRFGTSLNILRWLGRHHVCFPGPTLAGRGSASS